MPCANLRNAITCAGFDLTTTTACAALQKMGGRDSVAEAGQEAFRAEAANCRGEAAQKGASGIQGPQHFSPRAGGCQERGSQSKSLLAFSYVAVQ